MKHLLNCKRCDWHEVVDGSAMEADVRREMHDDPVRGGSQDCDVVRRRLPPEAEGT